VFSPASDGEALIHTVSTGVNPVDTFMRSFLFAKLSESQQLLLCNFDFVFCSYRYVADALLEARRGDKIVIASGRYKETL
jgi:hypothetical protein